MLVRACQQEYATGLNPGSAEAKALELCYTLFSCVEVEGQTVRELCSM